MTVLKMHARALPDLQAALHQARVYRSNASRNLREGVTRVQDPQFHPPQRQRVKLGEHRHVASPATHWLSEVREHP